MEEKKSSGAEKVESTEQQIIETAPEKPVKKTKAVLKEERKGKRMELKAKHKEERMKRLAELKEKRAERKAEAIKRREMLKNETATQRMKRKEREKKARLALLEKKRAERKEKALHAKELRQRRKEARLQDRRHRRENRRTPGFGGWLAAVISLGVTTLVLTTIVTAGAMRMTDMNGAAYAGYRSSFYEFAGLLSDVENNLEKLSVSNGSGEQRRIATDLLVSGSLAEGALERFPADFSTSAHLSTTLNEASALARSLLALPAGEKMSSEQRETLDRLMEEQSALQLQVNELANCMTDGELNCFLKKGEGAFAKLFTAPKETVVDRNVSAKGDSVSSAEAEKTVRKIFPEGKISLGGEATTASLECYNFTVTDERGRDAFVQVTKQGQLVFFDSYEDCYAKNYTVEKAEEIAEEFLETIGLDDMEAVFISESGTTVDFTFVYEQDDVFVYADEVKVKVCETKGKVIGFEGVKYCQNHKPRTIASPAITKAQAKEATSKSLAVEEVDLVLLPLSGKEILTYEVHGTSGKKAYLIYIDAQSGEEVAIYSVIETKQGRILK
ncbi:MAG: PepSY1/2 domain-containing protein [Christensenellaceae bacterium]